MDDKQIWDIYFASLAGWAYHPGNPMRQNGGSIYDHLDSASDAADRMLQIRKERWPDGQQQQVSQVA